MDKETKLERILKWRQANPEKCREYSRKYARRRREANREKFNEGQRKYRAANLERERAHQRRRNAECRSEGIAAYGGNCACCGEAQVEFLTIDHMNNDGARHRREIGTGAAIYYWLKRNGYPKEGFQLLCFNCNCAKEFLGYCPHEKARNRAAA